MSRGRGKSGSELGFILALSPTTVAGAGSTNPVDVGNYGFGTIGVITMSADLTVNVEGSNASDGTFAQVGCSLTGDASGLAIRSWKIGGSQKFIKASYDIEGSGSALTSIFFVMDEALKTPVDQNTNTTVYSTIA